MSLDVLQWPAMIVTVLSTWLVGSESERRLTAGFYAFLASNVIWVIWGWSVHSYAIVVMQVLLAALNIRGAAKNN